MEGIILGWLLLSIGGGAVGGAECVALVQFEIDAGKDYNVKSGGNNKNCHGKVTEKIQSYVKDLKEGSAEYAQYCKQSVLEASKV